MSAAVCSSFVFACGPPRLLYWCQGLCYLSVGRKGGMISNLPILPSPILSSLPTFPLLPRYLSLYLSIHPCFSFPLFLLFFISFSIVSLSSLLIFHLLPIYFSFYLSIHSCLSYPLFPLPYFIQLDLLCFVSSLPSFLSYLSSFPTPPSLYLI